MVKLAQYLHFTTNLRISVNLASQIVILIHEVLLLVSVMRDIPKLELRIRCTASHAQLVILLLWERLYVLSVLQDSTLLYLVAGSALFATLDLYPIAMDRLLVRHVSRGNIPP